MATQEVAASSAMRPAKAPAKQAPQTRKTAKPSAIPVIVLSLIGLVLVHAGFCAGASVYFDELHWKTMGLDAAVRMGEAQFELNAVLSFIPFDILFGFAFAVVIGFITRVPFFRDRVHHTVLDIKKRLMLQLSATSEEVDSIIRNDPENNTRLLSRRDDINVEGVQSEISSINSASAYLAGKGSWLSGLNTYMKFHFVEEYANKVQGLAYGGAAFLIIVVGIRGLKFIPATRPSFIIFALGVEFTMLVLLAVTLIFTEEEERTDRILKQMVDAVKGGKGRQAVAALESQEQPMLSRGDYEKIVREQMDKKILEVMADKDDDALRRIALDLVTKG